MSRVINNWSVLCQGTIVGVNPSTSHVCLRCVPTTAVIKFMDLETGSSPPSLNPQMLPTYRINKIGHFNS